ncbi:MULTISPECIES: DUF4400 domain-containing protein [Burkholderia cepacia complex]|uniref:DUF4400 domain-containing protein n=3 Tax=Burkholderia cepacia complex TaxID=87882 RepID=A0A0H3KR31_BURM1|nr:MULTISPECIES: DUF4400 domain-containing protein [Burkholderia cepacia complex]ABX19286.1 conserved hypothetical protein [Burkholderia multivorans ATCC 17616]AIO71619.1 hypothetical protein DM80_5836 [Burkholderia multivorans]AOK69218.1 hypothetical protein WM33_26500 [Burkholderia multivorans]KVV34476.1 hypothetical protein WK80_03220 [Burkholderia multivorans]KVZ76066.1 hypothetical protein WL23_21940 [Burkholderia multivorans]
MAGSRFVGHIKMWFFFVPLLSVALMPAAPDPSLFDIPDAEAASVASSLGEVRTADAIDTTNRTFKHYFVATGLVQASMASSGETQIEDGGVANFASRWVHNFWRLVYRMVYRITVMKYWLLGMLVFGIAMFTDGTVRRKVRAAAAGYVSPLSFHLAGHGILLVFGVTFTVLIAPLPLIAPYWLAIAACLGALLWKAASTYQ